MVQCAGGQFNLRLPTHLFKLIRLAESVDDSQFCLAVLFASATARQLFALFKSPQPVCCFTKVLPFYDPLACDLSNPIRLSHQMPRYYYLRCPSGRSVAQGVTNFAAASRCGQSVAFCSCNAFAIRGQIRLAHTTRYKKTVFENSGRWPRNGYEDRSGLISSRLVLQSPDLSFPSFVSDRLYLDEPSPFGTEQARPAFLVFHRLRVFRETRSFGQQ